MRSGSITPEIKETSEIKGVPVSHILLNKFYENWIDSIGEEINQIEKTSSSLSKSNMNVLSSDIQAIKDSDKYFKELAMETSSKASKILQARRDESINQLELMQKLLKEWSFFKTIQAENEDFVFEDVYSVPQQEISLVSRYGININSNLCVEEYNKIISAHFAFESPGDVSSVSGSKKSSKKGADKSVEYNKKLLHAVEVFILQKALDALQMANASKVVLFDIFERNIDGTINMQDKIAKCHTIVLCAKGDKQFELVDPSNSDFSVHLMSDCNRKFITSGINISLPRKNIKLYIPGSSDSVGSQYNQFRDCIDIAVKIAFAILDNIRTLSTENSVYEIKEIQELSNQQDIDSTFPEFPKTTQYPLRVKQSSSKKDRHECHILLRNINNELTRIAEFSPYEIDIAWEEMQQNDNHNKSLMWLKQEEQKLISFANEKEKQNKIEIDSLTIKGLKLRQGKS